MCIEIITVCMPEYFLYIHHVGACTDNIQMIWQFWRRVSKWGYAADICLCWLAEGVCLQTGRSGSRLNKNTPRALVVIVCASVVKGNECWVQWAAHHVQHLILTLTAHQLTYIPLITHSSLMTAYTAAPHMQTKTKTKHKCIYRGLLNINTTDRSAVKPLCTKHLNLIYSVCNEQKWKSKLKHV